MFAPTQYEVVESKSGISFLSRFCPLTREFWQNYIHLGHGEENEEKANENFSKRKKIRGKPGNHNNHESSLVDGVRRRFISSMEQQQPQVSERQQSNCNSTTLCYQELEFLANFKNNVCVVSYRMQASRHLLGSITSARRFKKYAAILFLYTEIVG